MTEVGPSVASSDTAEGSLSDRLDVVESRLENVEDLLTYHGDGFDNKLHQLQSLIVDVRSVLDALLDAGPEHDRDAKVDLALDHRERVLEAVSELEQLRGDVDTIQERLHSTSKVAKAERILEFADGKRNAADAVAVPSDDIYGLLTDCSPRRCRQLMDEFADALSFCETDRKRRSDGKTQKRLKIDFSRKSLEEMQATARRCL